MLAIIAAQLFGLNSNAREIKNQLRYSQNSNAGLEDVPIFIFIVYAIIGSFTWPIPGIVNLWRTGHPVWSIVMATAAILFFIGAAPVYLIFGFCWSVIKFGMTYL